MKSVKRSVVVLGIVIAACGGATSATTSITADVATTRFVAPSTTEPSVVVEVQSCASPPVTFSPLCEIYDLLETWYVDAPVDPDALAGVAIRGLEDYVTSETADPPRTLFCAIPDQAFTGLCDELAAQVRESRVEVGAAVEAAVSHMIDVGLDPFTYYLPPGQTDAFRLNGIVGGIGVLLDARDAIGSKCTTVTETCRLEIVVVFEDNAGFEAGLQAGDLITAVGGQAVEGRGFTAIVSQIAGDETGTLELSIERDGAPMQFTMERAELTVPTVEYGVPLADVGYIRIPDFEFDIPELVTDSLEEVLAADPSTLVVDLRDNPGGYVDAFVEVADEFVDGGIVMISDAPGEHLEYEAEPGGLATGPRLLVLVNKGTASAAEILAGALRDRRGALILGSGTFGKDAVQIPFTLRNGGEFYVAVARWSTPDGDTVANGGLTPDREITWPAVATVEEIVEIAMDAAS
jgi:carboxyl-terminal processing protease